MTRRERGESRFSKDGSVTRLRKWWAWSALLCALAVSWGLAPGVVAQDAAPAAAGTAPGSAGPAYKSASEQEQLELLRRLLGVEAPVTKPAPEPVPQPVPEPAKVEAPAVPAPAPEPAKVEAPAPEPVKVETPASPAPAPAAQVETTPPPQPAPEPVKVKAEPKPKPVAKPKPKPAPKPASKPKTPAKAAPAPKASPVPEAPAAPQVDEAAQPELPTGPEPTPAQDARTEPVPAVERADVPPAGTIINAQNAEQWKQLLTPAVAWTVGRGAKLEVADYKPVAMEPARAEATERYSGQVTLRQDKKAMMNHVAGIPFPSVTESDPDAAIKLMFNFEQRFVIDDTDGRNFGCVTGALDVARGVVPERIYRIGHFRRLFHTGRIMVDPKPTWPTPDHIRYREMLGPLNEPFDLKGAGFTYNRYLDPSRQDDSWLYYPQTKRVRRLSTAQRSEGVFGQDVDLDSYAGFAGNPAWFEWQLLGKKTLLMPLSVKHQPVQWGAKPTDFFFDDLWQPRETYIIAARSLLPGYNFSLRVIYIDAESFIIPITEVYDHNGQLWRAYVQQTKTGLTKPMPYAKEAVYDYETFFVQAITVFDLQQEHATFCEWPAPDAPKEEVWYLFQGLEKGSKPEDFDVAGFIQTGR